MGEDSHLEILWLQKSGLIRLDFNKLHRPGVGKGNAHKTVALSGREEFQARHWNRRPRLETPLFRTAYASPDSTPLKHFPSNV